MSSTCRIVCITALLSLATLLQGCTSSGTHVVVVDPDVDRAAIEKLYADWRVAVANGDIPAYLEALHPEVTLFPPGASPIVGAAGYGKFLGSVFASATYRIEVAKPLVVEVFGDHAVVEYEYIINIDLKDQEAVITEPGALTSARNRARYFDVLRRQADGRWGVWRHLWHDMPLAAD